MSLTMKERFSRLQMASLPESIKKEFNEMDSQTYGFSDQDLNEVFEENFNDLYSLVSEKYPDAIKLGGTIVKEKPAKVKVVKPKKAEPVKVPAAMRKKLSVEDIEFLEDQLTNDESSTDEEMVMHFMKEVGLTESQAKKWVALRDKYMSRMGTKYSVRTELKKGERKGKNKNIIKTRDGFEVNRKDPANKGMKFYDENGKEWKCVRYDATLDECILEDNDGKEISCCLKDMYKNNPKVKREKGDLVDECKDTLKEAGYTVKEHKAGTKKIKRKEPRPERDIIKERVESTFIPILKDISGSEEKEAKYKPVIEALDRVEKLVVKFFNRLNNLAEDGKTDAIEKIEKLFKELLD